MSQRKTITAGELYVILDREFRSRQSSDCTSCYFLLPFRVDQHDGAKANWEVIVPPGCPHDCSSLVDEIVDEYGQIYELAPDAGND
jgi:hypothetical protein